MELTIEGLTTAQASGPITIELPPYMYLLEAEEMVEARVADNRADLILAAGRHPTGNILFITGDGYIREIDCDEHKIPNGPVNPVDFGQTICVHLGKGETYEIAADWALENAQTLLAAGVLGGDSKGARITYVDE